ncbi:hypothetical protein, partial [Enterobacter asburiae]
LVVWQSPRSQRGIPLPRQSLPRRWAAPRWLTCSINPLLCSFANKNPKPPPPEKQQQHKKKKKKKHTTKKKI